MADVRVTVDLAGVEKKVSPQAMKRGKIAAGSEALLIMEHYVPLGAGGGALRASGHVEGKFQYHAICDGSQTSLADTLCAWSSPLILFPQIQTESLEVLARRWSLN